MAKAFNMQKDWIINRCELNQFNVQWGSGKTNKGDYFTKHHASPHHKRTRPIYLNTPSLPQTVQGCNEMLQEAHKPKNTSLPISEPINTLPATSYLKQKLPGISTMKRLLASTVLQLNRINRT